MERVSQVSIFFAGGDQRGSAYNNKIAIFGNRDSRIDKAVIREYLKEQAKQFIRDGCPCVDSMKAYIRFAVITDENAFSRNISLTFEQIIDLK